MRDFFANPGSEDDAEESPLSVHFPTGLVITALNSLAESYALACDAACDPWDFAVELDELRRLGVSRSGVRWLLTCQLAAHAYDTTPLHAAKRSFLATSSTSLFRRSCFVITQEGLALFSKTGLKNAAPRSTAGAPSIPIRPFHAPAEEVRGHAFTPRYDAIRAELLVGAEVVKRFRRVARNQQIILQTFEESSWTSRIDDPLPPCGDVSVRRRLAETIRALNSHHLRSLVRFQGDGTGEGIRWAYVG